MHVSVTEANMNNASFSVVAPCKILQCLGALVFEENASVQWSSGQHPVCDPLNPYARLLHVSGETGRVTGARALEPALHRRETAPAHHVRNRRASAPHGVAPRASPYRRTGPGSRRFRRTARHSLLLAAAALAAAVHVARPAGRDQTRPAKARRRAPRLAARRNPSRRGSQAGEGPPPESASRGAPHHQYMAGET